jgi:predicted short-subunit dehydrogenase-like oxidoreductase (DUF2520 family)
MPYRLQVTDRLALSMMNYVVNLLKDNKKLASIVGDDECEIIMQEVRKIAESPCDNSVPDSFLAGCIL